MPEAGPDAPPIATATLAAGEGWRVVEVTCRSGPADRPFEERHAWTSVAAVLEGTFTYRSAGGRALMTPHSLLLGSADTCFECGHAHGRGDRCVAFQFAPALLEETAGALPGRGGARFRAVRIPPLDGLLPTMARIRALRRPGTLGRRPDPLQAETLALEVLARALALDAGTTEAPPSSRDERRVAAAIRLLEAHHAEPVSIAGLARRVGMTRRPFASAFRHGVGMTPYRYVLNLRLDAAARRLEEDRGSVLAIALQAGFGDLSEFTRRFRARFGAPPAAYRRGMRETGQPGP